ncbi:hypothetical protein C5167_035434 [Papaver somniferum]|uniref:Uncharacterized protein n=1 Tax=Papaver somniferum TaxID=3469 RepID=A0A4Y7KJB0_PAPSO|nr:hypothetical protein C5167_035434 [Papaver somniferum]
MLSMWLCHLVLLLFGTVTGQLINPLMSLVGMTRNT